MHIQKERKKYKRETTLKLEDELSSSKFSLKKSCWLDITSIAVQLKNNSISCIKLCSSTVKKKLMHS